MSAHYGDELNRLFDQVEDQSDPVLSCNPLWDSLRDLGTWFAKHDDSDNDFWPVEELSPVEYLETLNSYLAFVLKRDMPDRSCESISRC